MTRRRLWLGVGTALAVFAVLVGVGIGNAFWSTNATVTGSIHASTVTITFPTSGTWYDGSGTGWNAVHGTCPAKNICGTVTAPSGTVSTVAVQVEDLTTQLCGNSAANGATFTSTCSTTAGVAGGFFPATNTGTNFSAWRIVTADATHLAEGHQYLVTARATDAVGTQSTTATFGYDNTAPTITNIHVVNADTTGLDALEPSGNFYVIATVADTESGVQSVTADISALDGVAGDTAVALSPCASCAVRGTSYTYKSAVFTAVSTAGNNKSVVLTATDNSNAANTATGSNATIAIDNTRPTVKSIAFSNHTGGTRGKPEAGDVITVTYSSVLSVPSVCSTWSSADTTAGTVTSAATLTITKGATDTVTVAATDCTLHFGSINLGSTGYVSGSTGQTVTFAGTSIVWDGASKLTITLGSTVAGTGTAGTLTGNSTATYTPDANISDVAGNLISGTASVKQKMF